MKCPICNAWAVPEKNQDPGDGAFVCENGDVFSNDYWARRTPGVYLELLHGRDAPDTDLDDWGFGGPVIGPLVWFHTTYLHTLRLLFVNTEDAAKYGLPIERNSYNSLAVRDDMIEFQGNFYGDWSVFNSEEVYALEQDES